MVGTGAERGAGGGGWRARSVYRRRCTSHHQQQLCGSAFHIGEERFAKEGQQLANIAGQLARHAADTGAHPVRVAGSLPPLFGSYRPDLFQPERVAEVLLPLLQGLAPHVDLWLAETQSSIAEVRAIHQHLPEDGRPFWVSFTLQDEEVDAVPRLRSGEPVADAIEAVIGWVLRRCCSTAASRK